MRFRIYLLAVTVALFVALFASTAVPQAAQFNAGFKFVNGDRWTVETAVKSNLDVNVTDLDGITQMKTSSFFYEEKFVEEFSDVTVSGNKIKLSFLVSRATNRSDTDPDAKPVVNADLQDREFVIIKDADKKTYTSKGVSVGSAVENRLSRVNEYTVFFPASRQIVSVGDSWAIKPEVLMSIMIQGLPPEFTKESFVKCLFKEVVMVDGKKIARFTIDSNITAVFNYVANEDGEPAKGYQMDIAFKGDILMDAETSDPVSVKIEGPVTVKGADNAGGKDVLGKFEGKGTYSFVAKYTLPVEDEK